MAQSGAEEQERHHLAFRAEINWARNILLLRWIIDANQIKALPAIGVNVLRDGCRYALAVRVGCEETRRDRDNRHAAGGKLAVAARDHHGGSAVGSVRRDLIID